MSRLADRANIEIDKLFVLAAARPQTHKATNATTKATDRPGLTDGASGKKETKNKSELDNILAQCSRIRGKYLLAVSKAKALQDLVGSDEDWAWCRGEANIGSLSGAASQLAAYVAANGLGMFLQENPLALKRSTGADHRLVLGRRFVACAEAIDKVERTHPELIRMHKARGKTL